MIIKQAWSGLVALTCVSLAWGNPPRFTDITTEAGLAKPTYGAFVHAIAWGDVDGDGRLDLFLGTFGERGSAKKYGHDKAPVNMLLRQSPSGFARMSMPSIELPARCSGAVFADLDNDGDADLYVSSNRWEQPENDTYKRPAQEQICRLYRNDRGTLVDVSEDSGACLKTQFRCRDIGVFDFDNDGLLDLLVLQDTAVRLEKQVFGSRLFRNLGGMRFEDVTATSGLPNDLTGFGIAVADVNDDRRPDFYVCGPNRLYLGSRGGFIEAASLRSVFEHHGKELDSVTGAAIGDLDHDGDFDLITGPHNYHGPSRVHVFLNEGAADGVPRYREITSDLGVPALPQKAPHPEIQDFDNDGLPDLYWSTFFAEGEERTPFICRGTGVRAGLPRFEIPVTPPFSEEVLKTNVPLAKGASMTYFVNGPALDYDGDGDLDLFCGNWPPAMCRLLRNDAPAGNWLQVRVEGAQMNRMGVGARVRILENQRLLGMQDITLNGGYSSSRPALVHFGLGQRATCDVEVILPSQRMPIVRRGVRANQVLSVRESPHEH